MSFLLDQDTCIAAIRQVTLVTQRVAQHLPELYVSALTVFGLELWVVRPRTPLRYSHGYLALCQQLQVVNVDAAIAQRGARTASGLRVQGRRMNAVDVLVAGTALVHGLTLVTHSPQIYAAVPGLTMADWLVS
jgi:tRNA(fMet)-specific endonuclease VapC